MLIRSLRKADVLTASLWSPRKLNSSFDPSLLPVIFKKESGSKRQEILERGNIKTFVTSYALNVGLGEKS